MTLKFSITLLVLHIPQRKLSTEKSNNNVVDGKPYIIYSLSLHTPHTTYQGKVRQRECEWYGLGLVVVVPVVSTTQSIIMKWSSWVKLEIAFPEVFSSFLFFSLLAWLAYILHITFTATWDRVCIVCSSRLFCIRRCLRIIRPLLDVVSSTITFYICLKRWDGRSFGCVFCWRRISNKW